MASFAQHGLSQGCHVQARSHATTHVHTYSSVRGVEQKAINPQTSILADSSLQSSTCYVERAGPNKRKVGHKLNSPHYICGCLYFAPAAVSLARLSWDLRLPPVAETQLPSHRRLGLGLRHRLLLCGPNLPVDREQQDGHHDVGPVVTVDVALVEVLGHQRSERSRDGIGDGACGDQVHGLHHGTKRNRGLAEGVAIHRGVHQDLPEADEEHGHDRPERGHVRHGQAAARRALRQEVAFAALVAAPEVYGAGHEARVLARRLRAADPLDGDGAQVREDDEGEARAVLGRGAHWTAAAQALHHGQDALLENGHPNEDRHAVPDVPERPVDLLAEDDRVHLARLGRERVYGVGGDAEAHIDAQDRRHHGQRSLHVPSADAAAPRRSPALRQLRDVVVLPVRHHQ
mmetsp:Transcript_37158/g.95958  ORF Transcript_37158/g.95958 Transcript_37158/m.95958 type:complete len:402 (-) Transcript_37158:1251-2456(-)